ncbi:MAG TPA: methyltransferase domain-containing protein [Actinomycetota bacterium]|nr:methyltransferase domain-containing protein [Actinomycetota bacterium]
MKSSKSERAAHADFAHRYSVAHAPVLDEIERRVIGDVWGANGFTTAAQADILAESLGLTSEKRLLDLGTGRGWPGLYLAKQSGCEIALTDLPAEGLGIAARRGSREHVRSLGAVVSSAARLPFRPSSFDAIVHTDVLC